MKQRKRFPFFLVLALILIAILIMVIVAIQRDVLVWRRPDETAVALASVLPLSVRRRIREKEQQTKTEPSDKRIIPHKHKSDKTICNGNPIFRCNSIPIPNSRNGSLTRSVGAFVRDTDD
jgi:hypothetical protein